MASHSCYAVSVTTSNQWMSSYQLAHDEGLNFCHPEGFSDSIRWEFPYAHTFWNLRRAGFRIGSKSYAFIVPPSSPLPNSLVWSSVIAVSLSTQMAFYYVNPKLSLDSFIRWKTAEPLCDHIVSDCQIAPTIHSKQLKMEFSSFFSRKIGGPIHEV